jgi:hypothetical protein
MISVSVNVGISSHANVTDQAQNPEQEGYQWFHYALLSGLWIKFLT